VKALAQAQKQENLAILQAPRLNNIQSQVQVSSGSIRESFDGWLQSVVRISPRPLRSISRQFSKLPKLTAWDVTRVNHVTIREGESHCIWPPAVVQFFQTAEVITDNKARHYELRDSSLRRVG
jgi:hypothetical protein